MLIGNFPTLSYLEGKSKQNETLRETDKPKLIRAINWAIMKKPESIADFAMKLQKENISVIARSNKEGLIYGITFIDHRNKCVFNGSDIGKSYSISAIQERIAKGMVEKENKITRLLEKKTPSVNLLKKIEPIQKAKDMYKNLKEQKDKSPSDTSVSKKNDILKLLLRTEKNENRIPFELLRKKKKKRRPSF